MLSPVSLLCLCLPAALTLTPVDLAHHYDSNTLYWPTGTPFHYTQVTRVPTPYWYAVNDFETAEHAGTHLDAPYHFNKQGWHVGEIPLPRLFGKAVVLNLRTKATLDPDYLVTGQDFEEWEKINGPIPEGAVVLLDFGWASKYNNRSEYFGTEDVNDTDSFHFPGLSEDGAKWLVRTDRVYGVGTDTASIDFGQTKEYLSHRILAANNIYNLEHLALPVTPLPANGFQVVSLPMKLRHGTGAPVRVVALLSDN